MHELAFINEVMYFEVSKYGGFYGKKETFALLHFGWGLQSE